MKRVDVVVVGGGPAGLSAAAAAAESGATVALIEETAALGGKVLKHGFVRGPCTTPIARYEQRTAQRLMEAFRRQNKRVSVFLRHQVWNIEEGRILDVSPTGGAAARLTRIHGERLVIATGAMERCLPVSGWTLPGVFTLGGLNALIRNGVRPGTRFVIAGSGPLVPVLAHNLILAGASVAALVMPTPLSAFAAQALPIAGSIGGFKALQGAYYLAGILKTRIPVVSSAAVSRIEGRGRARSVRVVRIDSAGRRLSGPETVIAADAVAIGHGLIPGQDLVRCCGCRELYDEARGYWRTIRNDWMETTVPGVFVAGDGATVKGYAAAAEEGRIAGSAAAARLEGTPPHGLTTASNRLRSARRFGRILDTLSTPAPALIDFAGDDTRICRCEEVTMADIRQAVADGAVDINDNKRGTRCGMGQCQGRFCGQVINEVFWRVSAQRRPRARFTPRIPAKPVAMGDLGGSIRDSR